jgi:hypothetical protein
MGQFQQSSMWAEVKAVDGWECLRVVATIDEQIAVVFRYCGAIRDWAG